MNACTQCAYREKKAKEEPCATCLARIQPGEPLVFRNFEWRRDDQKD